MARTIIFVIIAFFDIPMKVELSGNRWCIHYLYA